MLVVLLVLMTTGCVSFERGEALTNGGEIGRGYLSCIHARRHEYIRQCN
jgi:hypothetical protein